MKTVILQIISGTIIIACLLAEYKKRELPKAGYGDYSQKKRIVKQGLLGMFIGTIAMVFVWLAVILTGNGMIEPGEALSFRSCFLCVVYFIYYIIVAVEEEMIFRGFLMGIAKQNRYSLRKSVIVSALVFAAAHLANNGVCVIAVINLTLFGVVFGLSYGYTNNLAMPIGIHLMWNFVQSILGFCVSGFDMFHIVQIKLPTYNCYNGGKFGPEAGVFTTIIGVILIIGIYFVHKQKSSCN